MLKLARGRGLSSIGAGRWWPVALPLLCFALALCAWPAGANATGAGGTRSVVLAFLPAPGTPSGNAAARERSQQDAIEQELASVRGLSVGIMSAAQGSYTTEQLLLDITQGSRIVSSAYAHKRPPALSLRVAGIGAKVRGFKAAATRAERVPALLRPGLLAAQIPGGAAYVGIAGRDDVDGVVAADRSGRVAAFSLGTAPTLLARVAALQRTNRLVVCDLPAGLEGYADLRALSAALARGALLIVLGRARQDGPGELLWAAAAGLPGGGGRELSSQTTNERGLISAIDLAPTILEGLHLASAPAGMRGYAIRTDGPLHSGSLRSLMARLRVIGGRRLRALACLLAAWALLLLSSAWPGRAGAARRRAWALRVGALGVLWSPVVVLFTAALEPSAVVELATITVTCFTLGALADALLAWPRAPLAPAIAAIVALVIDALAHTQLLMRSLLGPDPILGARFYGIGNELKSGLAVLTFAAVAAALYPATGARRKAEEPHPPDPSSRATPARRRAAAAMGAAGILLAVVEGSARIGAGVGGVILVSAGTAVAIVMLLEGRLSRRRALFALISPAAGLVALAALDLATAHGSGHFSGSILHARSAGDIRDIIVRRYKAAWEELGNHAMPAATALTVLCAAAGVRLRARLLAPVGGDPVWLAALTGGLAAGVAGALSEDSGPVLLLVAVFTLGCVLTYLWGRPPGTSVARRRTVRRESATVTAARATSAAPGP